jgi:sporulation protein YlmC with PRC-barrel domain
MPDHDNKRDRGRVEETSDVVTTPVNELRGKTILSLRDGEKLGQVDDVLIDPNTLRISGLVSSSGGLFDQRDRIILAQDIDRWGKDAVLVQDGNVFRSMNDVPDKDHWISAANKISGLSVVSSSGDKIGQLDDVIVDNEGQLVAYRVSSGFGGRSFGRSREIPANTTRKLGKDVVIVDVEPDHEPDHE